MLGVRSARLLASGRRVVRRLADGGAHEVFLVAAGPRGLAAAKLPRPHLAGDPHSLLGLKNEARALERLAQPTAAASSRHESLGSHPHLLLEYVPGPTLTRAWRRAGRSDHGRWRPWAWSLACTLEHIAATGWVHLDIKPSNIVLNDRPCLLDFELAMPATDAAGLTEPTGTWAFMPPEQRAAGTANAPGSALPPTCSRSRSARRGARGPSAPRARPRGDLTSGPRGRRAQRRARPGALRPPDGGGARRGSRSARRALRATRRGSLIPPVRRSHTLAAWAGTESAWT